MVVKMTIQAIKALAVTGATNAFLVMVLRTMARENTKNQANPGHKKYLYQTYRKLNGTKGRRHEFHFRSSNLALFSEIRCIICYIQRTKMASTK